MTKDEKMALATFRFGIIAEFVTGVRLGYGEKKKLLDEKAARTYQIPMSKRTTISRSSLTVNSRVNPTVFELQYKKPRLDRGFSFYTLYLSYLNVSLYQNVGGLLIES